MCEMAKPQVTTQVWLETQQFPENFRGKPDIIFSSPHLRYFITSRFALVYEYPGTTGMNEKGVVVLTGFGPFREYKTNASWEVVKAVKELGVDDLGIQLTTKEIEVSYQTVLEEVPKLWLELKPTLVIHLGVSGAATDLTIESCAHKSGYSGCDVNGKLPPDGKCLYGDCEDVYSGLDLQKLVEDVKKAKIGVTATISNHAGRYLCEFIYYTSLSIDNRHALFIHVPDIGKPYTLEQMAQGIKAIIGSILDQMEENSNCENVQLSAQNEVEYSMKRNI